MRFSGAILFVIVLAVGWWGYHQCSQSTGVWADIYKSIQHFALASDAACISPDTALEINLARFGAAVLLVFTVIRLLSSSLLNVTKLVTQAANPISERYILIGYGAINQEIAGHLARSGCRLTIAARAFDGAARDFAAKYRCVLVEGDVREPRVLRRLMLRRATRIIVALGEDSLTLETAQLACDIIRSPRRGGQPRAASETNTKDIVFAHFTGSEMHRQFQMSADFGLTKQRGFTGFAIREAAARYLFSRTWLAETAAEAATIEGESKPRLHVVIVGAGDLGMAMTREAVLHGCSAKLGRPKVTIVDRESNAGEARFRAAMPHLFDMTIPEEDRPEIKFTPCSAEDLCPADLQDGVPITAWILCCGEDATNHALAMRLEGEMRRGLRPPAPIYPRIWQGNVRDGHRHRLGQEDPWRVVVPFGGMQDVVPTLGFLDKAWLEIAQSIHAAYDETVQRNLVASGLAAVIEQFGPPPWDDENGPDGVDRGQLEAAWRHEQKRFRGEWADLPEDAKLANLAAAYQSALRLWELGYDWKSRFAGGLPMIDHTAIKSLFAPENLEDLSPETRLGAVCEAEHRRWMVERAMRGWSAVKDGEGRQNELKLHTDFRSYGDLYAEARSTAKDATASAATLGAAIRRLDAASLRGVMQALEEVEDGYPARAIDDAVAPVPVAELPVQFTGRRMTISVSAPPDLSAPKGTQEDQVQGVQAMQKEEFSDKVVASVERLQAWARPNTDAKQQDHAFEVRLVEQDEGALAHTLYTEAFDRLLKICKKSDVQITVKYLDMTKSRSEAEIDHSA
ncbi:MAG: NAD-binding protein [Pseudomonadota bacterium]